MQITPRGKAKLKSVIEEFPEDSVNPEVLGNIVSAILGNLVHYRHGGNHEDQDVETLGRVIMTVRRNTVSGM